MGDKSPKAKEKAKKQGTTDKKNKQVAAGAKASSSAQFPAKKGK
jgi:hypothetical protein